MQPTVASPCALSGRRPAAVQPWTGEDLTPAMPVSPERCDPLLVAYLRASDPARREAALQDLLDVHVDPWLARLVAMQTRERDAPVTDAQDAVGDARLRLVRKLRRLASDPDSEPIGNLRDYVATTAHHVLDDQRRRRDPVRSRLDNRIRYVLTHTTTLALWGRDPVLCGLARWEGRPPVPMPGVEPLPAQAADDASSLRALLTELLARAGGPVEIQALVDALARALGLAAQPFVPAAAADRGERHDPLARLEGRQYLQELWRQIAELPLRQRRALLLQLRLEDGESVARLLPVLGIASPAGLAAALELPEGELVTLWDQLPLDDQRIAAMLGASRQQVINLRKSARDRLARRMGRPR
jgi:DNA-directed RNA polymerase specialized sigma24 family protein